MWREIGRKCAEEEEVKPRDKNRENECGEENVGEKCGEMERCVVKR